MKSLDKASKYLEHLHRFDLVKLLQFSQYEIKEEDDDWAFDTRPVIVIASPEPYAAALKVLPPVDCQRISEAIGTAEPQLGGKQAPTSFSSVPNGHMVEGADALLAELVLNRELMIDVATGGTPIQKVNDFYIARQARIREAMSSIGLPYENPHDDLWDWYGYWKQRFGTYSERREYVRSIFKAPVAAMASRRISAVPVREPTGWERVDRTLAKARSQLEAATNEEDFQAVGLLCREVLISLAQAVYVPEQHGSLDGTAPSPTDAKRMLEAYLYHAFGGSSHKEVRAHARASIDLALNLQHRRTANYLLAALCLEATSSTVHVTALLADRSGKASAMTGHAAT